MKFLTILFLIAFSGAAHGESLQLLTEKYPPFSFKGDDGGLKGISVDQVTAIMAAAKLTYKMEMLPWARAFSLAETMPSTCVFTTGMLAERKAHFKWVEPLVLDVMVMVRKSGEPYHPTSIEEAKAFVIGVHRDDSAETYAQQQGFPRLDSAPSLDVSLKKLLNGRVQLMIMTRTTYETLRRQGQQIESVLNLEGTRAGIACNLAVPDETIARMQRELDRIIADGTQAEIYRAYGQPGK